MASARAKGTERAFASAAYSAPLPAFLSKATVCCGKTEVVERIGPASDTVASKIICGLVFRHSLTKRKPTSVFESSENMAKKRC